ncbi:MULTISPECIES: acyltransferase family protein [unclassified Campylobacter]|uniref:acyltransferase family protein n=1 Tax=unclassified Campylobacter TaxID=2593542 RepID=UPI0022E9C944|nr:MULTISPECIES: acyltransferase [unclassified Campylobacter]MDA3065089.1 acyltransferase [Campylobacter sp. CN_NE4]MDA3067914.1 acyltransferase [Campylobacter sp. CN_NE3]MDA3083719.1 acyltransferase [Campylobacter sp. CN_NE1]MDA3086852.1 acyltransferase [Campylobacter sp. CN_NA2]WBR52604.1 acyltransferase [Campylobacter sp. CN_NE2]
MIGYLRLILACGVMFHHILDKPLINFGPFCVFIFYILAGSVSTKLLNLYSPKEYLKDRFLRIYPVFFLYISLAFLFFYFSGFWEFRTTLLRTLAHFTLIPLNYNLIFDIGVVSVVNDKSDIILPPAFSLALEVQIYFIFALLFALKKEKFMKILAIISFIIFTISNLVLIDNEMIYMWDYRYFWGVFFVFYIGKLIREKKLKELRIWWAILFIELIVNIYYCDAVSFELPFAVLVGIPLVYELSQIKFKAKFNSVCGALSYHIFLNHALFYCICMWKFDELNITFMIISSFLFGLLAYKFIEKPIERIRFKSIS